MKKRIGLLVLLLLWVCSCGQNSESSNLLSVDSGFIDLDDSVLVCVEGQKLYYQNALTLLQYDIDSRVFAVIAEEVESFAFLEGHVYYIEHASRNFSIYKQSLETGERQLVRGSGISEPSPEDSVICDAVIALRGELYYTTRYPARLYKFGDPDELLADFSDVSENVLLHLCVDDDMLFCKYTRDGIDRVYKYDP